MRNNRSHAPFIHEISDGEESEHKRNSLKKQEKSDDESDDANRGNVAEDSDAEQNCRRILRSQKRNEQQESRKEGVQTRQRIRSNISDTDRQLIVETESEAEVEPPKKKRQHVESTEEEDEENAFVIDKILACETHTMKVPALIFY